MSRNTNWRKTRWERQRREALERERQAREMSTCYKQHTPQQQRPRFCNDAAFGRKS